MGPNPIVDFYELASEGKKITLSVSIGFAQNAVSNVELNLKNLVNERGEDIFEGDFQVDLGNSATLRLKKLEVTTHVHDINNPNNPQNRMFIRYTLKGGKNEQIFNSDIFDAKEGEIVMFTFKIKFFKPIQPTT